MSPGSGPESRMANGSPGCPCTIIFRAAPSRGDEGRVPPAGADAEMPMEDARPSRKRGTRACGLPPSSSSSPVVVAVVVVVVVLIVVVFVVIVAVVVLVVVFVVVGRDVLARLHAAPRAPRGTALAAPCRCRCPRSPRYRRQPP